MFKVRLNFRNMLKQKKNVSLCFKVPFLFVLSCFTLLRDMLPYLVIAHQRFVSKRLLDVVHGIVKMKSLQTSTHYQNSLSPIL